MESTVLLWLKRASWLAIPLGLGLLAYTIAMVLREPTPRRWTIALVTFLVSALVLGVVFLVIWIRKRRKAGKLEDGLVAGGATSADRRAEIDALRKQWKESVAALRASGAGGGGRRALAVLPWYVIIGAPASGKSTLLRQSGIDFPVGDAAIRGLQGTRNCDWWFSNVGIFLDTAGRYMSDESASEWTQFLDLVRRHRMEAPIQGVIVAIPAPDLVSRSAADLDAEARRIRARLDELIDHLGINFPVWVTLTKVDLIGGFAEMFSRVNAQARRQMCGWTADVGEGARFDASQFEKRFRALVDKMRDIRPVLVGQAPLRERPMAYAFPDEFAAIGEPLSAMLRRMFEPNVYQETPLFRGLFVTSATQQGTPLQKAALRVRELLGVAAAAPAPESVISHAYFVQDLVHERIVPDRHMTWTTRQEVERGRSRRIGINLVLSSVAVFLFFCVIAFGSRAARELDEVEAQFQAATANAAGGADRATCLRRAADATSDDNYRNLGLSAQRNLKQDLEAAQHSAFRRDVLGAMASAFQAEVAEAPISPGPDRAVESWRACREVRSAMTRASQAKGDVAADAFLTEAERKALLRLRPRLAEARVVSADGAAYPDDLAASLLVNREDIAGGMKPFDDVDAAFARRAGEYVDRAAAAVAEVAQNDKDLARYVEDRLGRFRKACEDEADQMERSEIGLADLQQETLGRLADAAAGVTEKSPESSQQGGEAEKRDLVMSVGVAVPALKALAGTSPAIDALLKTESFARLAAWAGATPADAGKEAPVRKALDDIAVKLRELGERASTGGLVPDPWPDKPKTVREALAAIDKDVDAHEKEWRAAMDPLVAALGSATAAGTPSPWRAVLLIEPVLRRNAMLRRFVTLERRGGYASLAKNVLAERQALNVYDRDAFQHDLDELVEVVPAQSEDARRLVAKDVAADATNAVVKQYEKVVAAAKEHWDAKCTDLPPYTGGDPWVYLRRWTNSDGAVALLAADFRSKFGGAWTLPAGYTGARQKAARDAWAAADRLRNGYAFYWRDYGDVREALAPLVQLSGWAPDAAAKNGFDELARGLRGDGTRPVWDPVTLQEKLDPSVTGQTLKTSLESAIRKAEDGLLGRVLDFYNMRWRALRSELTVALGEGGDVLMDAAGKRFESFAGELEPLFGPGLNLQPGGRLRVLEQFRQTQIALNRYAAMRRAAARGFTVTLRCNAVAYPKEGGGAADYPYVELLYVEEGPRTEQRFVWEANKRESFAMRWSPGRGAKFQISLLDQKKSNAKVFRDWFGANCLIDALRDGGGGSLLEWPGRGEFSAWNPAKFDSQPDDPQTLAALLTSSRPDPAKDLALDCVARGDGR